MQFHKPPPAAASKGRDAEAAKPASKELGLTERRRSIRPLPVPEAVESDGDTDWAAFQALSSNNTDK